jgi:hypothetical protein
MDFRRLVCAASIVFSIGVALGELLHAADAPVQLGSVAPHSPPSAGSSIPQPIRSTRPSPALQPIALVHYEYDVPTPGDRPAFEKADSLVGQEPGEQPPWSLTNLWDYDERRSRAEAGRNPLIERRWRISGNTVQSFVMNPMGPKDRFNGPTTWTDRSDDYQLNQQWIYVERATDTSCQSWDIGGRVDFNYGTNYRWQTSAGLEDHWVPNTTTSFYGIAMPQAYIETAYEEVKVKWGHFISPIGYATVDTTQNFFFTIPYTYQYGEPFTHWGALATWSVSDELTLGSGVTRGWNNFNGGGTGSHGVGWIGTASYVFDNEASIAWVASVSIEFDNRRNPKPEYSTRYVQSLVFSLPFAERWNYVVQTDFGTQSGTFDFHGTRPIGTARWYGLNQYLFYAQNKCVAWGVNFEWFRDEGGFRVGTQLPTSTDPASEARGLPTDRFGYIGNFYQLTFGPKFTPSDHLFIRPNGRFDWFSGTAANPGNLQPYGDGLNKHQFILGFDVGLLY